MRPVIMRCALLLPLALVLAACNQTASAPPPSSAPVGVTPSTFAMPQGEGCAADVARWKAIQDNDLATGHVTQKVYDQIAADIAKAKSACEAGRDAEARGAVAASRKRHGYPAG